MTATRMAWGVALEDVEDVVVTDAARAWLKSGEPKWPSPGALLAKLTAGVDDDNAAAWSDIRGYLTKDGVPRDLLDSLTRGQRAAYLALPSVWDRKQMSSADLNKLERGFLASCRAYQPPAAPVVITMSDPRRIPEATPDLSREQAAAFTRRVFAQTAPAARSEPSPCAGPSKAPNGQGGPKEVKRGPIRGIPDEAELRERARVAADIVRARMAK